MSFNPRPPPLDYASRRQRRVSLEDRRAFVAGCGLIVAACVVAGVVGVATSFVLHELFGLLFGK